MAAKKMTQKEKRLRAQAKSELQKEGILPPDKPKLSRKKFAKDVIAEYEQTMNSYGDLLYLQKAIGCMVSGDMRSVSSEEVGVLKLLKIAIETKKFMKALEDEGRTQYTIGEFADKVVLPVIKL